jgi:hypothetical protein
MVGNCTRNHTWFRTLAAFLAATMLATACGGGGGGGGGPKPPPVGPGDTEKFFPDAIGDTWFYDATLGDPAVPAQHEHGFRQMAVTGTKSFGTAVAKIFTQTSPSVPGDQFETYYSKDNNGVTNHGNDDPTDTLTPTVVPYLEAKFPVATGVVTTLNRSNVDFGQDLDGDSRNEKVDFKMTISVDGFEAVTVPAGTFGRSAARKSTIEGTVKATTGGSVTFTATETLWSAPGVGVVKQLLTVSTQGISEQESYEARGYMVDGVRHGMGLPRAFLTDLVANEANVPAVASDGNEGFVVATVRQTSASPIASKIVAAFGDADGKFVREVDVTNPTEGYMAGRAIDMAFDGTNYLLLYSNGTSNTTPNPLLATRISPSGTVLDGPTGFEIDEGSAGFVAVAYGNSNYLVVFSRYDNTTGVHQLYGRLVTPSGNVVGAGEFPIGPHDENQLFADVAFDGTNFLVVWQQQQPYTGGTTTDFTVVAARVNEAGVVLDPNGFVVSNTGEGSETPRVAFGGGQYLVVWVDGRNSAHYTEGFDIYGARVDTNGVLVDGPATTGGLRISGDKIPETGYPQAVYTGGEFLVTWNAGVFSGVTAQSGIFGARVAANGSVSRGGDNYGIALSGEPSKDSPNGRYAHAKPVRLGSRHVVTWVDSSSVRDVTVYSLD